MIWCDDWLAVTEKCIRNVCHALIQFVSQKLLIGFSVVSYYDKTGSV